MPKDRRARSGSFERRSRVSPYPCRSSAHHNRSSSSSSSQCLVNLPSEENIREWEEARCPVCMEHPHNAVLLQCSSGDKGCHPYMCDTSYRHSNCLDQFRKSCMDSKCSRESIGHLQSTKLTCPLCRGDVSGWTVVESARQYMNAKGRSCALESCGYNGTYCDLRKHARVEHPSLRPSSADPERQRDWRRMEQQHDIQDLISSIHSSLGEEANDLDRSHIPDSSLSVIFFIIRVFGGGGVSTSLSQRRTRSRIYLSDLGRNHRLHWGETYDEEFGTGGRVSGSFDVIVSDGDGRPEEVESSSSERGRGRIRRRMRLLEEDDFL